MNQPPKVVGKRPAAMFSLAVCLGLLVSQVSLVATTPLHLIWLPTSIVLVGLLTRGPAVLLPAALCMAGAMWIANAAAPQILTAAAAVVIAPFLTEKAIQRLRTGQRATSHLTQTIHLFVAIAAVQAPVSAIILSAGWETEAGGAISFPVLFVMQWIIETTTGVIFVRGLMTWMPNDGSGFCPVAGMSGARRMVDPKLVQAAGLIAVLVGAAWLLVSLGFSQVARLLSIGIFVVAAGSNLVSNRRTSSTLLMVAALAIVGVHLLSVGADPELIDVPVLVELELLLLTGASLLHLLNSLVEERLAQQRKLKQKAFANEVTDLPNLRALNAYLQSSKSIKRVAAEGLLMAEVSVAGLSRWADLSGRASIMAVEREIGARLRLCFGGQLRFLVHIGTGRFILVLSNRRDDEGISLAIRTCFESHRFSVGANQVRLHYSIGIVETPPGPNDLETTLASLSIAQQQAAKSSQSFYRMALNDSEIRAYREDLAWVEKVSEMMMANRLRLFAQPIAPAKMSSRSPLHFEVLARMLDDSGAILTPDKFLPAISLLGQQVAFDQQVVRLTFKTLAEDPVLARAVSLCAINVTGPTISDPDFPAFLTKALNEYSIRAESIAIEVTESDAIDDIELALSNVARISGAGIKVAVDDFGTGRATFEYIRRLKPDILKIDGSFVRRFAADPLDREIVQSIVRLADAIGAKTVAEFVESEEIAGQMRAIGLDFLQGWAIAKPMPIGQIKAFCDKRRAELATAESEPEMSA